jgi:hypothetical protein
VRNARRSPQGSSPLHEQPAAVTFKPFHFSPDGRTLTMPYTRVSHSEAPRQTAYVAFAGRETSRTCVPRHRLSVANGLYVTVAGVHARTHAPRRSIEEERTRLPVSKRLPGDVERGCRRRYNGAHAVEDVTMHPMREVMFEQPP